MWWHFATLSHEEVLERRHLLDLYAFIAQISALTPLFLLQLYFFICWIRAWISQSADFDTPSSPRLKWEQRVSGSSTIRTLRVKWRECKWWTGGKVGVWRLFDSTRGEMVAAGVWMGWLIFLCLVDTKHDYLHMTKRFGIVGASQLPMHYLLALKTPYSPLQTLTRRSWESLNNLHQFLGRIITLLFYLHAAFYLNFFVQANLLGKRIKDRDVILGLTATVAFTVIGTTAFSWIRKLNYRVFYVVHVVVATMLLPILFFHVSHIRIYIWESLAVYILHTILRVFNERTVSASVALVPGTRDLLEIKIPLLSAGGKKLAKWEPGQHLYLALQRSALLNKGPIRSKNPFTIASLPSEDGSIRLIARVLDGNTAALAAHAKSGSGSGNSAAVPLAIEGPYGLTTHSTRLLRYSRVLFIAGGVGATFIVPLYRALLRDLSPSPGSPRRQNVRFIWAVRDLADTNWALESPDTERREAEGMSERMTVYVTRGSTSGILPARNASPSSPLDRVDEQDENEGDTLLTKEIETGNEIGLDNDDDNDEKLTSNDIINDDNNDNEDGVELEHLLPSGTKTRSLASPSSSSSSPSSSSSSSSSSLDIQPGRPNIPSLIDSTFQNTTERDEIAIFVCGPKRLAADVRAEVGAKGGWGRKREVWFWSEEFAL